MCPKPHCDGPLKPPSCHHKSGGSSGGGGGSSGGSSSSSSSYSGGGGGGDAKYAVYEYTDGDSEYVENAAYDYNSDFSENDKNQLLKEIKTEILKLLSSPKHKNDEMHMVRFKAGKATELISIKKGIKKEYLIKTSAPTTKSSKVGFVQFIIELRVAGCELWVELATRNSQLVSYTRQLI